MIGAELRSAINRTSGLLMALVCSVLLAACANQGGAYYQNDGPGSRSAAEFLDAADVLPRDEPIVAVSTRPYTVFGRRYYPLKQRQPLNQVGEASWYGKQFHGRPTSIGDTYDMYAMTAAHPTLPLPSYVRVTNVSNGRSVVVRVNDRGPFLNDRIIDLSFAAAAKLEYTEQGTAQVVTEVVDPMVVTLQQVRQRRGLAPASAEQLAASAANTDEAALPLRIAATLPQEPPLIPGNTVPGATVGSTALPRLPQLPPIFGPSSDAVQRSALGAPTFEARESAAAVQSEEQPEAPIAALPLQALGTPQSLTAAQPEPVESVELARRQNRVVADVYIPPDFQQVDALPDVGPPPLIVVEPFEGKGLRRAVPERFVPAKPPVRTPGSLLANRPTEEPFVIPYKDRLPAKPKGPEKPAMVYLQLGAYETEQTAQKALTQVQVSLSWMRQPVSIINDRGEHKLQAGPFSSAGRARRAAKRIRARTALSPFYVFR